MALETITREEFDQRLDAANTQHTKELQQIEEKQENVEQLLSYSYGLICVTDVTKPLLADGREHQFFATRLSP